ncbi:MAG: hypothetical protein WD278_07805 [Pirellulales bacterium]
MRFPITIERGPGGNWLARHSSKDLGDVEVQAAGRDETLEKMKNELRYRLELCPCTGESYRHIDVEVTEQKG